MITEETKYPTWEELLSIEAGTVLLDWYEDGVRCLIMRAGASLTAYVGVPLNHPLSGFDYDALPLRCHGGLTFASEGNGDYPEGFYWYGWDYAHAGDFNFYDEKYKVKLLNDKKWQVKDVMAEMWSVVYDFKKLMALAEAIKNK